MQYLEPAGLAWVQNKQENADIPNAHYGCEKDGAATYRSDLWEPANCRETLRNYGRPSRSVRRNAADANGIVVPGVANGPVGVVGFSVILCAAGRSIPAAVSVADPCASPRLGRYAAFVGFCRQRVSTLRRFVTVVPRGAFSVLRDELCLRAEARRIERT